MISHYVVFLALLSFFPILSYLIGSIPFGLLLTRFFLKKDIRKIGSGNTGATNVLRTGSKKLAFLTLLLDGGKGAFAIAFWMAFMISLESPGDTTIFRVNQLLQIGLFAVIGHCFPVWLKFRGGKGVATAIGVLLAAAPWAGLAACAIWLAVFFFTRISSASALAALAVAPVVTFAVYGPDPALIALAISAMIFWRHKDNIRRIMKGDEPKFGQKKE